MMDFKNLERKSAEERKLRGLKEKQNQVVGRDGNWRFLLKNKIEMAKQRISQKIILKQKINEQLEIKNKLIEK